MIWVMHSVWKSHHAWKQKKYIKAYKNTATESNVALFTFLKFFIKVENDQHLLYLP